MNNSYTFPRELRLLTPKNFQNVFSNPVRASTPELTLLAVPNKLEHPRLGLTISKKNVKLACKRNRLKRIIRESYRLHQHQLPAVDIVAIGKKGIQDLDNPALHKMVEKLWRKLTRRYNG
ncbi:ribonuclease P protein component [Paraferrimonas sp. SM1919]|uniref:ribonuclease P protein component n=1 Tax=Paraferrimonas sp. SM1919 TaxID=2662263 RepID=UPI001969EE7C|nr:ribonuclease P protein component [Paraferrimonas sp. SM1919]